MLMWQSGMLEPRSIVRLICRAVHQFEGVPPLCHHLQGVTHHYTTIITDPYQRLQNNQMQMVGMLDASLHSRG